MSTNTSDSIDRAAELVAAAGHVVALIGAGLSVESGVPTFRGPGGLWTRLGEPSMNGFQQFINDPAKWWEEQQRQQDDPIRAEFREAIENAKPNPGHYALAEKEQIGVLKIMITQNVDDLHFRAGSKAVAEIHGNRTKVRCIGCELRWHRDEFVIEKYPAFCPECGGLVKSDTVMFGEPIPGGVLSACFEETAKCDCILVVGTSATVYPAAGFPEEVKLNGGVIVEANPNLTQLSSIADATLRGPTGESLPMLVERVKQLKGIAK